MRNTLFAFAAILLTAFFAFGQNEQAPIVEKEINYKNWTYKSVRTGEDTNLRDLTVGKKLVIVVYYAPWCGNWRFDAPMLQRFYDKYKSAGLEIVAVGEYDPVSSMQNNLTFMKITFPAVYESENRSEKQKTKHYDYRQSTGDTRGWGSPWYIFLQPSLMEKKGDTLTKKTFVINGEMIADEGEKFIREKLGLPAIDTKAATAKNGEVEVCDPADKKTIELKKPL
ncbi:MAG: redoxin domain-containing protein [Chloracidobacterium sp.]|nr:redoxin domain-containing protein [Chloracidobacterium sp.]